MKELRVDLPDRSYPVYVGTGLLERAHGLVPPQPKAQKVVIFYDAQLTADGPMPDAMTRLRDALEDPTLEVFGYAASGEQTKSAGSVEAAWQYLATNGFHRNDVIIGIGGGALTDMAGFVAATFNRGMPWVVVPTTLLGMVDASIGGKTAINLPQGKNLVGAFHHPLAVIADVDTLATLPDQHLRTGMAEVIKHGFIDDASLLERARPGRDAILARDPATLQELVADAAAVKVRIVSEDPEERGVRAYLNYGHTLGHALEALGGYERITHGEAVAIGMMFAAHLARALGYADLVSEHETALAHYGLATSGAAHDYDDVARVWGRDKKFESGMRFVVLEELGEPRVIDDVPEGALRAAYEAVR